MKKYALALGIAAALATGGAALANTQDILVVTGEVDEFCYLDLQPQAGFQFDNSWHVVGLVGVACNNGNGFASVEYLSTSNGFEHSGGGGQFIRYEARSMNSNPTGPVTIPDNGGPHTVVQNAGAFPNYNHTALEYRGITDGSELSGDYTALMQITVSP